MGTVPTALTTRFPLNSSVWSGNCLANVTSRYAACDMPERAALVDLFAATNGQGWSVRTNWLSSTIHPCSWFGVGCAVAGVGPVEELRLGSKALSGALPSSLGSLTALT